MMSKMNNNNVYMYMSATTTHNSGPPRIGTMEAINYQDLLAGYRSDPLLSELVAKATESPNAATTKDFLRPVFKWLKFGCKHYAPEKAFQLSEWVLALSLTGDASMGLPVCPQLQPTYIFNTIVTMSQRNNRPQDARRAHARMTALGLEPDIFTLTALIDVVGRNGCIEEAYQIYSDMLHSQHTLPNVVTYCTLLRMTSKSVPAAAGVVKVRELLRDACSLATRVRGSQVSDQDGVVDTSIFNAALAASVKYQDRALLVDVLREMRGSPAVDSHPLPPLTYEILCKFVLRHAERFPDPEGGALLESLLRDKVLSLADIDEVKAHMISRQNRLSNPEKTGSSCAYVPTAATVSDAFRVEGAPAGAGADPALAKNSYVESMSYLGPRSPASLRATVLNHDLTRLAQRLLEGSPSEDTSLTAPSTVLCESDFVTLIHQCRKRKWFEQVDTVLTFMRELSTTGIAAIGVPAHSAIKISLITAEAALESFFAGGLSERAWVLFSQVRTHLCGGGDDKTMNISEGDGVMDFSHKFSRLVISGFVGCMDFEHTVKSYFVFRKWKNAFPPKELVHGILRAAGRSKENSGAAITILADLIDCEELTTAENTEADRWLGSKILPQNPIYLCLDNNWSGHAISTCPFLWNDFESFLQTLLRSCALLSDAADLTSLIEYILYTLKVREGDSTAAGRSCQPYCGMDSCFGAVDLNEASLRSSFRYLSDCFVSIVLRWDSYYMTTLLMAACSESISSIKICEIIHDFMSRGFAPPLTCLYSLAQEAFGHSWSPQKKAVIVFETKKGEGSLPFRSFVLVGILKYLDSRTHFLESVVSAMRFPICSGSVFVESENLDWVHLFLCSFEIETSTQNNDSRIDPAMACILGDIRGLAELRFDGSTDDIQTLSWAPFQDNRSLSALLFLQHSYARFINVKTKEGKLLLENNLILAIRESFGNFRSLWIFSIMLFSHVHLLGAKSDEKVVIRFWTFLLTLLNSEILLLATPSGVPTSSDGIVLNGKTKQEYCTDILRSSGPENEDLSSVISVGLVSMITHAAGIDRNPFDYLKTTQKTMGILQLEMSCRIIVNYLSQDIAQGAVKIKLNQVVDFLISNKACVVEHLDTQQLEQSLADHLRRDALYYKPVVEYVSHIAGFNCETNDVESAMLEKWNACVRIVSRLLSPQELEFQIDAPGAAAIGDFAVKLLFKFHPVTLGMKRDAISALSRRGDIDAVLDRFPSYAHTFAAANDVKVRSVAPMEGTAAQHQDSAHVFFNLPVDRSKIVMVNDKDTVALARSFLLQDALQEVAIDVEWKPMSKIGDFNKCSLIQIACKTHIFLFDLMCLEPTFLLLTPATASSLELGRMFSQLITELFTSERVLKLGFGLKGDMDRLRDSFPSSSHYHRICCVVDLKGKLTELSSSGHNRVAVEDSTGADRTKGSGGLSQLLFCVCGAKLDKTMQVSNWEERPLCPEQIDYAAKDAYCLISIWEVLQQKK